MADIDVIKGVAVIIDDEIDRQGASILDLVRQINERNIPCIKYKELPDQREIMNFRGISFILLDWDLRGELAEELRDGGSPPGAGISQLAEREILGFIENVTKRIFAPIFLFSQHYTEDIRKILLDRSLFHEGRNNIVFIESKDELTGDRLFQRITEWTQDSATVYAVKEWEKEYHKAVNKVFIEFYNLHKSWPYVLWKTFKADNVNPSRELGEVITKNIHSRMAPFEFEDSIIGKDVEEVDREEIRKVLEGERFVSNDHLHKDSIALGDVFKRRGKMYINVRPDCDCIGGRGNDDNATLDDVDLYLIRGSKLSRAKEKEAYRQDFGQMIESISNTIIFSMLEGSSYCFQFKNLKICSWGELKNYRVGRLLPPYITRLHQRYAYYLHRPGIPRIPEDAINQKVDQPVNES